MTNLQIAWLELALVGGMGVIIAFVGILISVMSKRKNRLCTEKTKGIVVKYGFPGEGRMCPIVQYMVNGKVYQAKKKFRGVKTMRISWLPIYVESKAYEDEKGWLHVKIGPIVNLRQLAEQLWPINSEMMVYYNPDAPQKCYVERPLSGSFTAMLSVIMGLVTIAVGVLIFFLIQR